MSISLHPQSASTLAELNQLANTTAATQWRGLLVIRAEQQVRFQWPASALVLADNLAAYREYLGISCNLLVLDMRKTLHADALAATLPTVRAQGLAILVLPPQDTPFSDRLLRELPQRLSAIMPLQPSPNSKQWLIDLSSFRLPRLASQPSPSPHTADTLKPEQREVFNQLMQHVQRQTQAPAMLNAPRGRGKSTLLGVLAQALIQQSHQVWVCAPSRRQAATLLSAAGENTALHYIAPDVLLAQNNEPVQGCLIVDEAASLPRHMLDTLVSRYPQAIMATTSEGYEACGRGFLLQFQSQLAKQFSQLLDLQLTQPIRFGVHCPVEHWLNRALLLSPSDSFSAPPNRVNLQANTDLGYSLQHASALDEPLLASCFQLLMDAHYQTSPNDLKLLLNDTTQTLCLQWAKEDASAPQVLVGVVWLSKEGGLDHALADAVMRGTRRPAGNLLAQSLAHHLQSVEPAQLLWLRVVRIAVPAEYQQQGLGSKLLQHIVALYLQTTDAARVAGIGTSFASAPQINRFWSRHCFVPIRMGSRKDSATGRHSLLMLRAVDADWQAPVAQWSAYFAREINACQQLYGLTDEYLASLPSASAIPTANDQLALSYASWATHRVKAFAEGDLDLDSVRPTLLTHFADQVRSDPLLSIAVHHTRLQSADKRRLRLSGRKDLIQQVRQLCLQLLARI